MADKTSEQPERESEKTINYIRQELNYGKVDYANALPKGFKPNFNITVDAAEGIIKSRRKTLLLVTVPPRGSPAARDENDYSELLMSEAAKSRLFSTPGFPKPVPKAMGRVQPYKVKMTPNMGMGVFATRDIKMGELVFAERPLFGGTKNINMLSLEVPGSGFLAQKLVLDEYEKLLELCVERMSEANRTAYMSLTNSHKEDGSGPLTGISRTNGYGVAEVFDGVGPKPISDDFRYAFVGNIASRINHSCLHNVIRTFDIAAFAFIFTAVLDIKAGEQIFYPYCNIEAPVAVRRRQLAPYGIVCECRVCTNATPESDKFRGEYKSRTVELFAQAQQVTTGKSWPTNDEFRELLIFQKAAIEEGLHAVSAYQGILGSLTFAHMGRGHVTKVQELQVKMQKFASIF